MRERLAGLGIACPRFAPVRTTAEAEAFADGTWPLVLKAVSGGYDGKGVWVCESVAEAESVLAHGALLAEGGGLIAEEYVAFDRELAVLAARSPHRQGAVYPVVQTVQRDGICREVIAPAPGLASGRRAQAQELALRIAKELGVTGLLAVEMFETPAGLLVNELAMRPHNTGHWTIEGALTSQFEQHVRAVLDLPLGSPELAAPAAVMANVLGGDDEDVYDRYIHVMAADPAVKVHMYGKQVRPGRKIGHVTALGEDVADLADRARRAASYLRWGKEDGD
jgi:5-(carboxyamino)imidazole ribonucleotide synthase